MFSYLDNILINAGVVALILTGIYALYLSIHFKKKGRESSENDGEMSKEVNDLCKKMTDANKAPYLGNTERRVLASYLNLRVGRIRHSKGILISRKEYLDILIYSIRLANQCYAVSLESPSQLLNIDFEDEKRDIKPGLIAFGYDKYFREQIKRNEILKGSEQKKGLNVIRIFALKKTIFENDCNSKKVITALDKKGRPCKCNPWEKMIKKHVNEGFCIGYIEKDKIDPSFKNFHQFTIFASENDKWAIETLSDPMAPYIEIFFPDESAAITHTEIQKELDKAMIWYVDSKNEIKEGRVSDYLDGNAQLNKVVGNA